MPFNGESASKKLIWAINGACIKTVLTFITDDSFLSIPVLICNFQLNYPTMRSLYFTVAMLFSCSTFGQVQNSLAPKKFNRLAEKEGAKIIDVRTAAEWRSSHIAGAKLENVGKKDSFLASIAQWNKEDTYLLYCRSGRRSQQAMELMRAAGFSTVYDLAGGMLAWEKVMVNNPAKTVRPLHRVVVQLSSGDTLVWKGVVNNLKNMQQNWGDSAQITVVVHGPAIDFLLKDKTTQSDKITFFSQAGISFLACENSITERNVNRETIVPEAGFVKLGLGEVIRLQERGWSYIKAGH
jgi:intracellular sulfur oxidation DsrE/DsrF family protein/rhodanese-related sulfurtransferase